MAKLVRIFKRNASKKPDEAAGDMEIGTPTNVSHNWHVGFNPGTQAFEGLPPAWSAWLDQSSIRYNKD